MVVQLSRLFEARLSFSSSDARLFIGTILDGPGDEVVEGLCGSEVGGVCTCGGGDVVLVASGVGAAGVDAAEASGFVLGMDVGLIPLADMAV